jgi:PncC family amidohydrolase
VSYANQAKQDVLGVQADTLQQYGAVSQQVAEQMAEGVRRVAGSDYAIATTGIAGPTGGSEAKPVGTVWIAIATPQGTVSRKMTYGKIRIQNIERATTTAINLLRLVLLDKLDTVMSDAILKGLLTSIWRDAFNIITIPIKQNKRLTSPDIGMREFAHKTLVLSGKIPTFEE